MSANTLLMVADSERDANMLYASRLFIPDPFIYLRMRGRCHIVASDLEIDRVRKEAPHCRVISLSQCQRKLQNLGIKRPGTAEIIHLILKSKRLKKVCVPHNFPIGIANDLVRLNIKLAVRNGLFFPQRELKAAEEVKKISAALMMAEVGLAEGIQALKCARVGRKRQLTYHNVPLTSEKLRSIIETAIIQAGGLANHTIVAGGRQGCYPHEAGHGILRANEPIILDVYPRSQKTGYFGDITRTVVKGRASETWCKLYHTVERAQEVALEHLAGNIRAEEVHQKVRSFFEKEGYKTGRVNGTMQGFFHATGHGVGLEIHESPRLGANSVDKLKVGQVVTIEPGLYYPELGGGIRLEDMAHITRKGPRNLTKFEKVLEV